MAWVVGTCLLIDIADADPQFAILSADLLNARRTDGLVVCSISYVELTPVFSGQQRFQDTFLNGLNIIHSESWTSPDTIEAHAAWNRYVQQRRTHRLAKRPLADILIGAFAMRFTGLLTRNLSDFQAIFPNLVLEAP